MRKAHQLHAAPRLLPSLPQISSRKDICRKDYNHLKENDNLENQPIHNKFKMQPAHHCLPKKTFAKNDPLLVEQLLEKKLTEKQKTDVPTQPKMNRPWIAKEIDLNKLTTKRVRITTVLTKAEDTQILRRKSCQHTTPDSSINDPKLVTIEDATQKFMKKTSSRAASVHRDKIYSCKIAIKKGVFPMLHKKQQNEPIEQFFETDEMISTIHKKSESEETDLFMSFESYLQMDL